MRKTKKKHGHGDGVCPCHVHEKNGNCCFRDDCCDFVCGTNATVNDRGSIPRRNDGDGGGGPFHNFDLLHWNVVVCNIREMKTLVRGPKGTFFFPPDRVRLPSCPSFPSFTSWFCIPVVRYKYRLFFLLLLVLISGRLFFCKVVSSQPRKKKFRSFLPGGWWLWLVSRVCPLLLLF